MKTSEVFAVLTMRNKLAIKACPYVSCYQCLETFDHNKVVDYTDDGQTGICPNCGCDSVFAHNYILDKIVLRKIHAEMFEFTIEKYNKE